MPKLIIFSGLPGTGKSTIAEALGRELGIPVFAKDWLESALVRRGFNREAHPPLGYFGYELLTTLAERQLALGQSAILDCVASVPRLRDLWIEFAQTYNAEFYIIECICSDEEIHRTRLTNRQRNIPDWPEIGWDKVLEIQARYPTWEQPTLTLDALDSVETNLAKAIQFTTAQ